MATQNEPTTDHPADPVAMQIYSALLGTPPRIARPNPGQRPRVSVRVRVETTIENDDACPFRPVSWRERIGRCVGYAARALDDARTRLAAKTQIAPSQEPPSKPIVLIGPAVRRKRTPRAQAA